MILLDQGQSAAAVLPPNFTVAVRDGVTDVVNQPITDMRKKLDKHTKRHTVNEVNSRQWQLNQWEKDRQFRVAAFTNKVTQYHAGDLFDIQSVCLDIAEHTRVLSPNLALNFGQPLPGGAAKTDMELDSLVSYREEELQPLFWLLRKLHCLVDNRVHLQQAARTTKVGYNAYYDHK